jgi:hypothetical protein
MNVNITAVNTLETWSLYFHDLAGAVPLLGHYKALMGIATARSRRFLR